MADGKSIRIFWHRDLPPADAQPLGAHVVEATSDHVPGKFGHMDEQWGVCYETLMSSVRRRLTDEITRLGGTCAHVLQETIEARHNDVVGDAWLHGRFEYMLFKED